MIKKVTAVTKVRKIRKTGSRRRLTMKGLYYREMINRIFNAKKNASKKGVHKNDKDAIIKEPPARDNHLLDKYV